jgi:hypothetical protein
MRRRPALLPRSDGLVLRLSSRLASAPKVGNGTDFATSKESFEPRPAGCRVLVNTLFASPAADPMLNTKGE